jgi:hypothetical protein
MTGRLPSKSGGATSRRIHRQLLRDLPPLLIDDLAPSPLAASPSASPSPVTSSPATIKRYTSRDPMSLFMLFNLMASVRVRLTLVLLFMLLNHASIRAMRILVPKIAMICILVLI